MLIKGVHPKNVQFAVENVADALMKRICIISLVTLHKLHYTHFYLAAINKSLTKTIKMETLYV
jgi:hypothetical protein